MPRRAEFNRPVDCKGKEHFTTPALEESKKQQLLPGSGNPASWLCCSRRIQQTEVWFCIVPVQLHVQRRSQTRQYALPELGD